MSQEDRVYLCNACHWEKVPLKRWQLGIKTKDPTYFTCLPCGEVQARAVKHTVLTPHKQGAMYFTQAFAQEAAKGINNKGGLVK